MKLKLTPLGIAVLLAASIFSLSINANAANGSQTCDEVGTISCYNMGYSVGEKAWYSPECSGQPPVVMTETQNNNFCLGYHAGRAAAAAAECSGQPPVVMTQEQNNNFCLGYHAGQAATTSNYNASLPQQQNQTISPTLTSDNNFTQNQTSNTLVCNFAVCDNSQFKEFGFDYDLNPLNIHIHKHSGVWHNEKGVFVPWSLLCNQGQTYLIQSCSDLVDSTGTLTQAGDRAVGCITNGLIISVAATTVNLPLGLVKSALGALAPMTGCDGIVNLNTIQTGPQVQSLLTAVSNAAK